MCPRRPDAVSAGEGDRAATLHLVIALGRALQAIEVSVRPHLTQGIEASSPVAPFVPSFALFGALALVATMTGAVATHLFVVGGSPAMPKILLLGSAAVVWARRLTPQKIRVGSRFTSSVEGGRG